MSVQETYTDLVWDWVSLRLSTISYGVDQRKPEDNPLPFMLSKVFQARFERVLRQLVIPHMLENSAGLLTRVSEQSEDQQRNFLRDYFNDRQGRVVMWETWQAAWQATMVQKEIPPKPEPKKRGLKSLLKKDPKGATEKGAMTEEDWLVLAKKIDRTNKVAEKAWLHIQGKGDQYISPKKSDGTMMMEFFGRSVKALKDQMTAIRQIIKQGGNIGKTFDLFQKNKKVDLVLLAVSYQNPDEFINGDNALKNIMRGQRPKDFPLIARFLPDHIKGS